jgi:alpha-1,2-mannosyltransferase
VTTTLASAAATIADDPASGSTSDPLAEFAPEGTADRGASALRGGANTLRVPTPNAAWLRHRRVRLAIGAALVAELGLAIGFVIAYRPLDLEIYLWGGRAVTQGMRLYLTQAHANWFTYPPFAAALFTPLAALPGVAARLIWELASIAAFTWSCWLTLKLAGCRPSATGLLAMAAGGLLLEPMYHTLYLGQVNLFLLALVLADIWRVARGRHAGIGIGVATAIKLTPGVFIILLLLARRTKDAVTAAASFAGCVLIGFLVDPGASRLYWSHLFYDTSRVGATYISNQSPYGALARVLGGVGHVGTWYYVVPAILGAVGLAIAATLARRGDWLGAAAVTATTGLLVSPISWTHHWVWIMPALVVLARGGFGSRVAAACGFLLFTLAPMWWTPHSGQSGDYGWHGLATVVANCFLIAGLAFVAYMAVRTWRGVPTGPRRGLAVGVGDRVREDRLPSKLMPVPLAAEWVSTRTPRPRDKGRSTWQALCARISTHRTRRARLRVERARLT